MLSLQREVTIRGLGGLLASRFGRLAGTGFGLGRGHTWHQIEVRSLVHQGAESKEKHHFECYGIISRVLDAT